MELDDQVCLCFRVTKRKLINFIRIENVRRPGQLSECYGAGTGCGWCRPFLKRIFDSQQHGDATGSSVEISSQEYAQQRADYVQSGKGTPP